jgi:hypothetical protein
LLLDWEFEVLAWCGRLDRVRRHLATSLRSRGPEEEPKPSARARRAPGIRRAK